MPVDWPELRAEFPALRDWTFLDTASFGQIPNCARAAMDAHFERRDRLACADFIEWFDDADRIRRLIGRMIGSGPEDVAFIPNSSTALSLLIGGIAWQPGDEIVTLEEEFPNQYYYAAGLSSVGVTLKETPIERFEAAITERTRLVAISMLSYTSGCRPPLVEMGRYLRDRGVLFYVDGTQGVGALPIDVREVAPDMLAVHGYKWMLAPNGAGFMYVSPKLREALRPNVIGWRSDRGWRNVDQLRRGAPEAPCGAEQYEGGMLPFALLYALEASAALLMEAGLARIEGRVLSLSAAVAGILERTGGVVAHAGTPIVAASFPGRNASELSLRLREKRVLVAARHGRLRVSPHLYNDENDLDRLEQALKS